MENIFEQGVSNEVINRLNQIQANSAAEWGTMNASQMLAHCNVTYEMVYDDIHPKPNFLKRFMLKLFVKNIVVSEKPYKKNNPTDAAFKIQGDKDFEKEKARLVAYIKKVQQEGAAAFDGKESHSFGPLSIAEWNNLFYKHLDHHLRQFGV